MANVTSLSQALTRSLTSTSSESDNEFLESCRAPTLLGELDDDCEELPGPDDDEDENEDENEDDELYDDFMVRKHSVVGIKMFYISGIKKELLDNSFSMCVFLTQFKTYISNFFILKLTI